MMTPTEAIQTWNAGHRHPGTKFKTQREAQAHVTDAMRADPAMMAACKAELAAAAKIVEARRDPNGTHGCIITAERHRTLTTILRVVESG